MKQGIVITTAGTVLAGLILLFFQLPGLIPNVLSAVLNAVSWFVGRLVSSYSILGWAVLLLGVLALTGVVAIIILAIRLKVMNAPRHRQGHPVKAYTEDMVDGVRWRWRWIGTTMDRLRCYCPTCDAELVSDSRHDMMHFICERCPPRRDGEFYYTRIPGRIVKTVDGQDETYIVNAAGREILRRIRTGEYRIAATNAASEKR